MEYIIKRLNIKEHLTGLLKSIIKKLISPIDILFLTLSGLFISLSIFELLSIFIHILKDSGGFLNYIFQIKYQMFFGFISVLFFLITIILWIKHKVKGILTLFISTARKKSLHWVLLIVAFALNSFCFILN